MGPLSAADHFLAGKGVKHSKAIVYGVSVVIGGIVVFIVVNKVRNIFKKNVTSESYGKSIEAELGSLSVSGATISEGNAILIAQNLLNAMSRYGTDEDAVIDNLSKCSTAADLNLVIQKFGSKPYDGFGLATGWFENNVVAIMKNLNGWLRAELSGSSLNKVKEIYSKLGVAF